MYSKPRPLGQILVDAGAIDSGSLAAALTAQPGTGRRLGELLVDRGVLDGETAALFLAEQLSLAYAPAPLTPAPEALALVTPELARSRSLLPLSLSGKALRVAFVDPLDPTALDDVRFQTGRPIVPVVVSPKTLEAALATALGSEISHLIRELPTGERFTAKDLRALEREAHATPVVRMVDLILRRAIDEGASDIHMQEDRGELRVRFRVDGLLRAATELPTATQGAVVSRVKVLSGMDITEKRRPQDGGFALEHAGVERTFRVSTLPVGSGEKAVLRVLDPHRAPSGLDPLGLSAPDLIRVRRLLASGQGLLLVAGPTGSGKSTTLFGALAEVDRDHLNVVTLEDPVEYRIPGVAQVQVSRAAGLTFPLVLRSVLRQDPDVIMVGEIRDRETAEIAMSAAITGHLVLSTIHTTDAPGALTRLIEMGVPPFLVAGGVSGVVAQRLVRKHCDRCGGRGCGSCDRGYAGRTGVFQVLIVNDALREEVVGRGSTTVIRQLATQIGMGSLVDDARRKVAEGVTSPHEVGRVLSGDPGGSVPCTYCEGDVPPSAPGCPWCGTALLSLCACGEPLRPLWRFCPTCRRKLSSRQS